MAVVLVVSASTLVALAPGSAQALSIYRTNPVGNLSVVATPEGASVTNAPGIWADIPGLSTAAYSTPLGNLTATISGEMFGTGSTFVRALVDGHPAQPGDVLFKYGGQQAEGIRSFTFSDSGLSEGKHIVRMQWYTALGESAQIRDRTLSVNTAAADSGTGRLVTTALDSNWIPKTSVVWENVPNLARTITLSGTQNMKITFSALTSTGSGRFFARAVVDGVPTEDVLFEDINVAGAGARSYSFVKNGVAAGAHSITIQWMAEGGGIWIADRALSVYAAPSSAIGGGLVNTLTEQAPTAITSTTYVDVPNLAATFTTDEPGADVEVEVGSETQAVGGQLLLRATISGESVAPQDVTYTSMASWRAQAFTFVARNVRPGTHTVKVQMAVDQGATGWVGDRALNISVKRRAGVDFAQPFASMKPRVGTFPVVVICFDPRRPGVPAPSRNFLTGVHEGTDGGRNMRGWFAENTGSQLVPSSFQYVGCNDTGWFPAPAGRQGTWYWDHLAFPEMWQDALVAADPFVNFHAFDTDSNGHLSGDEVVVEIVRPDSSSGGYGRLASAPLDGVGTLTIDVNDAYLTAAEDAANRNISVGMVSHEACHLTLGAADMYANVTTRANTYSIMDWHGDHTHLDPFHKLKSGFVTPDVVEINRWTTRTVALAAVETAREITIVYDPAKADKEYFILENRWGGPGNANYDRLLPAQGIVVWHIVQDFALMDAFPPPGDPIGGGDWGRKGIRKLAVLSAAGQSRTLTWADGSPAGIRITAMAGPRELLSTEIAKL